MNEITSNMLVELVRRETNWLKQKISAFDGEYIIFPAGPTAQKFFHTLKDSYGIEAACFADNNPQMKKTSIFEKPVLSFEDVVSRGGAVLIPTSLEYYGQIAAQLEKAGITAYMHSFAYEASQHCERFISICGLLADEKSKCAYLGAIYNLLTTSSAFIQYDENEYFGIKEFANCIYDTVVDAGAYVGDTLEEYVKRDKNGSIKIYAFEPFDEMRTKLGTRVARLKKEYPLKEDDIVIIAGGVGAENKTVKFQKKFGAMLQPDEDGDVELQVYQLDDYFKDKPPFTVLKADIEGGEMDMLKGAKGMICRYKPKMAISLYHSVEEFYKIIEYVHQIAPEYRLFVRNHMFDYRETILYCIV